MGRGRVICAEKPPFVPCSRRSASSACSLQFFGNKKNHMPDARGACRTYDCDLMGFTPSTACELLPPPAGGPPPSKREVWEIRALSKILIQPRVQGRNPARFKGGYGVPRGFKGEKSKSPPNPLGLAERRSLLPPLRRSPSLEEGGLGGFAGQGLRPCRRLHIGALRSPL